MTKFTIYKNNFKMMMNFKLNWLFLLMLIISTMITLNSSSWLIAWMGLEINLMSFIPLMLNNSNNYKNSKSSMSYFIIQSVASSIMLIIMMMTNMENNLQNINLLQNLIQLSLILKLGMSPFHWWVPKIIINLNWMNCFILLTWQKIAPMFLMLSMNNNTMIYISMILSGYIGAIMGMNQNSIKLILSYSSINHLSWMIMAMNLNISLMKLYFLIYSFINMIICLIMNNFNMNYINQLFKNKNNKIYFKILMISSFLSMGGIPPFLGFLPKFFVLSLMIKNYLMFEIMFFILMTLITLSYYMNPLISSLMTVNNNNKWMIKNFKKNNNFFLIILINSILMLIIILSFFNLNN
uniref:NADH-ubiquinone oxidoreductase chain 2 n=1 Tax=Hymenoptera sp. 4 GYN-2021 TaxID=2876101 RepID=A0A977TL98_9HYME|nr:NADH dehydrogenase subunit 2 [Hymenoptera sp. 4 GYN-2021]